MTRLDDALGPQLTTLDARHLRRTPRTFSGAPGPRVSLDGRDVIQFSSNDYLGLAADPRLGQAAAAAISRFGCGTGSSRLIGGTTELHAALEQALADLKMTAASLVFASGYHANVGVVPALVGAGDVIFSDERNHASLIDGCRLSRARVHVYRHCDVEHLDQLLESVQGGGRRLVVTETLRRSRSSSRRRAGGRHGSSLTRRTRPESLVVGAVASSKSWVLQVASTSRSEPSARHSGAWVRLLQAAER